MDSKMVIGQRINSALAKKEMKQKELANSLGVTANTVSYYCSGSRSPNLQQIIQISKTLNVTTDYLLGLSDDPSPTPSAVDKLGLSPKAIEQISRIQSCDDAGETLQGLNMLLSEPSIILIASEIKKCSDAIKFEIARIENIRNAIEDLAKEEGVSDSTPPEIRDLQLSYTLEKEIIRAYPELKGRITIFCGQPSLQKKLEDLMSDFEFTVKIATGYYEYIESQKE